MVNLKTLSSLQDISLANVRSIKQDKYGFVWIGSQDGLVRFDGRNTIIYSKNIDYPHQISNNDVDMLQIDNDFNSLWVVSSYGGLDEINLENGQVKAKIKLVTKDNLVSGYFFKGLSSFQDSIYTCSQEGFLFSVSKKTHEYVVRRLPFNYDSEAIEKFAIWKSNILIFLNSGKIVLLDRLKHFVLSSCRLEFKKVYAEAISGELNFYAGTDNGICNIKEKDDNKLNCSFVFDKIYKGISVTSLYISEGSIFTGSNLGMIKHSFFNDKREHFFASMGNEKNRWLINNTFITQVDGNYWTGNEFGVSIFKYPSAFTSYLQDFKSDLKLPHAFSIHSENDSIIHIATSEGYFQFNLQKLRLTKIGGKGAYLVSCFTLPDGQIAVSGFNGTHVIEKNKFVPISRKYKKLKVLENEAVINPVNYKDSLLFFASFYGRGIFIYDCKRNESRVLAINSMPRHLNGININNIKLVNDNQLWILYDNMIDIIDLKSWEIRNLKFRTPNSNEEVAIFKDVCKLGTKYYFAVYGLGIVIIDENFQLREILGKNNGIVNVNLYKIFAIGDSNIIVTSNNGLYLYNKNSGITKGFFENDGLATQSFEQFCGFQMNNAILAGGLNGLTLIESDKLIANLVPPKLFISQITCETKQNQSIYFNLSFSEFTLPNDILQVHISLSGINWSNPDRLVYQWRILENESKWISLQTQNFVTLLSMNPGTYHLQVRAANEDGVWSEPKELVLIFLPKWYQTWWFYALIVLATAGIIYAFFRYRLRQIKKQHEIRRNIASDLHDDLGSTLNSVKVFTNLAISGVNQNESLQQVKQNLNEATLGLRDMLWVLDDSLDTVDELLVRLKQFAIPVTQAAGISFEILAAQELNSKKLSKEEKRNLYLICKEAVNNCIKYAGASAIKIAVLSLGKRMQIVINDNGAGFDTNSAKNGHGLTNMRYRATQIKWDFEINSSPGNGTEITVTQQ